MAGVCQQRRGGTGCSAGHPMGQAWKSGPGAGMRAARHYCGPGWSTWGCDRLTVQAGAPPHLHK